MLSRNSRLIAIIVMVGAFLFSASVAMAQRGPTPERTDKHLATLKERLKLSDDQANKIKAIMEESQKEAIAQREQHKGDPDAAAKFREQHRKATDEKIKAVLNDDQKKEFDKVKDEVRQDMRDRKRDRDNDRMRSGGDRRGSGTGPGPRGGRGGR